MKTLTKEDNYEPFGKEWVKHVMTLPKSFLVEQWKQSCLTRKELEDENKRLQETLRLEENETEVAQLMDQIKRYKEALHKILGYSLRAVLKDEHFTEIFSIANTALQNEE